MDSGPDYDSRAGDSGLDLDSVHWELTLTLQLGILDMIWLYVNMLFC